MVRAKNAVSGPGKLSARTDMSPAGQPVRVASGGDYGDRQASVQAQQSAPMAAAGPSVAPGGGGRPVPPGLAGGVFGPTERPGEAPTAMPQGQPQPIEDPDMLLRAIFAQFPHPDIERLLSRRSR
jgi:hypothetical protein